MLAAGVVVAGCDRHGATPSETASADPPPRVTLIAFALDGGFAPDRARTGRDLEAAARTLVAAAPDLLAVQYAHPGAEPGPFLAAIQRAAPELAHTEVLSADAGDTALFLLSRFPIVARRSDADLTYRMGDLQHRLDPGLLDVDVMAEPLGLTRVVVARLKDKVFHVSGQTEMRRNEARILARRLRRVASDRPLVVAATLNDTPESAPVRELTEQADFALTAIRPADERGDAWTWRDPGRDQYERADYVLVSPGLELGAAAGHAELLDTPALRAVSSHRALVVRFPAVEKGRAGTGGSGDTRLLEEVRWRGREGIRSSGEPSPPHTGLQDRWIRGRSR